MKKIAIDLLWVRPKQVGGIESYIRNLLDGFCLLDDDFDFLLIVSSDNFNTFNHYCEDDRFHLEICNIKSSNVKKRIIWQNLYLGKKLKKLGVYLCFEPYYCKPLFGVNKVNFITTIHDLQALHFPEYFNKAKVFWMKFSWWNTIKTSKKIIAISNFVKREIIENYDVRNDKIITIYNPIIINQNEIDELNKIEKKYEIKEKEYYFTVSSLLPHKNIHTLINVFAEIKKSNIKLSNKLIVSGVGGKSKNELLDLVKKNGLEDNIKLTGFIENSERNALYKNCKAFLFPSVFEGFGMPPIEAMYLGCPVITTRKTCLEEVTMGKANYVDDPYSVCEWIKAMKNCKKNDFDFSIYDKRKIAKKYLEVLNAEV